MELAEFKVQLDAGDVVLAREQVGFDPDKDAAQALDIVHQTDLITATSWLILTLYAFTVLATIALLVTVYRIGTQASSS